MARPTHEFMDSSQFILVYFDAENTGRKGGALAKAWRNGKHEDRHNISHVPATEGVDPQMQKKISMGLGNEAMAHSKRSKPQKGIWRKRI